MPAICYSVLRVPRVRATLLDACGEPEVGSCVQVVAGGVTSIAETREQNDRQDFFTLDADGQACVTDTSPPILKWLNLTLSFCRVDPELFNMLTGEPLVLDGAGNAVGFRTREGSVDTVNFALEAWTRISGASACGEGGNVRYGYVLYPWVVEGVTGDLSLENGLATFTVTARTRNESQWGVGPYNVVLDDASEPSPLLVPIASGDHRHLQMTELAPPEASCGCGPSPGCS
jgi:hypothetical protein